MNDAIQYKIAYSIKEAIEATSIGRTTLYAHMRAGRLQANKVGGRTLIPAASLMALVNGEGE